MSSAKPFVVRSNVQGVPPQTYVSNTQPVANVEQYSVRPDKQFLKHFLFTDPEPIMTIRGSQNFMITKILFTAQLTSYSAVRFVRVFTVKPTGSQSDFFFMFHAPLSSSVQDLDNKFRNIDFNPPLFVNMEGGNRYFQVDVTALAESDTIPFTIFGFFLD